MAKQPALLVLDLQDDFVGPSPKMAVARSQVEGILQQSETLVQAFRNAGRPVIYVRNEFHRNAIFANFFRRGAAIAGTSGTRWAGPLAAPDIWIVKSTGNAFSNPALEGFLKQHAVDSVVIAGVFADPFNCVPSTAAGAKSRGLGVTIASDAVGTGSEAGRPQALLSLARSGALVTPTERIVGEL